MVALTPTYREPPKAAAADTKGVVLSVGGEPVSTTNPISVTINGGSVTRVESLWTDDSGAFYVRVDNGASISWVDINGAGSAAPGLGARPAAGAATTSDRVPYQATASGTGYSIGDLIDHYVVFDPATGVVQASFWINTTTSAKIVAPAAGNIKPASTTSGSTGTGVTDATTARTVTASDSPDVAYLATIATDTTPATVKGSLASGVNATDAPVVGGGRASTANPTAVADGQVVAARFDKLGRLVTSPHQARELAADSGIILLTTTTETLLIAAIAGTFQDMLSIKLCNTSTTAVRVDVRDTTGGLPRDVWYIPPGQTIGIAFPTPLRQTAVNTNWTVQLSAAVSDVRIVAQFVKNI